MTKVYKVCDTPRHSAPHRLRFFFLFALAGKFFHLQRILHCEGRCEPEYLQKISLKPQTRSEPRASLYKGDKHYVNLYPPSRQATDSDLRYPSLTGRLQLVCAGCTPDVVCPRSHHHSMVLLYFV